MNPLSPPIGGRTTFRTKVHLNIKTSSIKGEVKIRVIILKTITIKLAHKVLVLALILIVTRQESLQGHSVTPMLSCL